MSRNIIIIGDCQIGGISATLKSIFPEDNVTPINCLLASDEKIFKLVENADYLIYNHYNPPDFKEINDKLLLIKFPTIYFPAFHPDIVNIFKKPTNEAIVEHYNSAIAIWCYLNNISIDVAIRLYNNETFFKLGYYNVWEKSIISLKKEFESCNFDFYRFIMNVKRDGVFMHSINHPKIKTLIQLGRMIGEKLGGEEYIYNIEYNLIDGLGNNTWPVYPEIGGLLSSSSSYSWVIYDRFVSGLNNFIKRAYTYYESEGLTLDNILIKSNKFVNLDMDILDLILSEQIKKLK